MNNNALNNTLVAFEYVDIGWYIFPVYGVTEGECDCKNGCSSPGKHPLTANGVKDATTNKAQIQKWWNENPNANIALATGKLSGVIVVDVDYDRQGESWLSEMGFGDKLSHALISGTGNGLHIFLEYRGEGIKNKVNALAEGVDIRGDGGYVVLPPSNHINGSRYVWSNGIPSKSPVNPEGLLELVIAKLSEPKPSPKQTPKVEHIPKGERNNTLTSLAGKLRHQGFNYGEINAALVVANKGRCVPPIKDSEVHNIVRSVCNYDSGEFEIGDMDDYEPQQMHKIDWSNPPPPPDWFVQGLVSKGDVVLLVGEPEAQKSWLALSLASAVVQRDLQWLDMGIYSHAPVIYVDEENHKTEVWRRLQKLGFDTDRDGDKLHYYCGQHLRLDKNPRRLYDIVKEEKPSLVILDSLIRLHTGNESSNPEMSKLWNNGITPLSRDLDATVLVLHHTVKSGEASTAFTRTRGAGDITAVIDLGLDVHIPNRGDHRRVNVFKPRHPVDFRQFYFRVEDVDDKVDVSRIYNENDMYEEVPF